MDAPQNKDNFTLEHVEGSLNVVEDATADSIDEAVQAVKENADMDEPAADEESVEEKRCNRKHSSSKR